MKIKLANYESYLIDYLDGNLDAINTEEMEIFLAEHPAIAEEMEDLKDFTLQKSHAPIVASQNFKTQLKKAEIHSFEDINEGNYLQFFVAHLEGDLDKATQGPLFQFLEINPSLKSEKEQIQGLKLQADTHIVFEAKENLKRQKVSLIPIWRSIAAVAALVLMAMWILKPQPSDLPIRHSIPLLASKTQSALFISPQKTVWEETRFATPPFVPIFEKEIERTNLAFLTSKSSMLFIEDEQWQSEMLLMQSYAFDRQQLHINTSWEELGEKKVSPFKILASLLWKTTKGQIKNMSQDMLPNKEDINKMLSLDNLSGGTISYEKQMEEKE
ncbi:MAG: hypothetical protein B7C24_04595 [Bacteroidetes bacterium 4572_77]|nr:MAG: hypothetical protein B7C24_04595 [Bacteroidetes bacterium 4572_77]